MLLEKFLLYDCLMQMRSTLWGYPNFRKLTIQSLRETVNAPECKNEVSLLLHTFRQNTISKVPRLTGSFLRATITFSILATPRFLAIKLRNPLGFSYIKNMLKGQLFKTSGFKFNNWLFGPEKFSALSRNRPLDANGGWRWGRADAYQLIDEKQSFAVFS